MKPADELQQALKKSLQQYVGKPMTVRRKAAMKRTLKRVLTAATPLPEYGVEIASSDADLAEGVVRYTITIPGGVA